MNLTIRLETPMDYRAVEELTREAFWVGTDCRKYIDEHLLVHKMRQVDCFLPELALVAELDGEIVGNIMYTKLKIITKEGTEHETLTFGPLSVLPKFQNKGIGKALIRTSFKRAKEFGHIAIIIFGEPDYYPRVGFKRAEELGLTTKDGMVFPAFMVLELVPGVLRGIQGVYHEAAVYSDLSEEETISFDKNFPQKQRRPMVPISFLLELLNPKGKESLQSLNLTYLGELHRFSQEQILQLPGMDLESIEIIRSTMQEQERRWGTTAILNNLLIRNAVVDDAQLLGKWWRNGKIMAHAGFPLGLNISDEEIASSLKLDSDASGRRLIIEYGGITVGEMSYRNIGEKTAEIGIKICETSERGKGIGTQALKLLIEKLFLDLEFEKIVLDTNLKNVRAQHVYEKIGFNKVRINYDSWRDQLGKLQSSVDYELSKTDWILRS